MSNQQSFIGPGDTPGVPNVEFVQGNDNLNTPPDATTHILGLKGDNTQGINITQTGPNTETVAGMDAAPGQKGVVELATNAETIMGSVTTKATTPDDVNAKLGSQTLHGLAYGGGNSNAVNWLAEAANGQIPIGQGGGVPILGNITSLDGSVTVTNGPGTIDLSVANEVSGTAQTINAVTADLITIPLGVTPGTYQFEARVKAFESSTPASAGYNIYSTFRTDGVIATLVGNEVVFNEDATLNDADAYFTATGLDNNAILQVFGVVALTLNWSGEAEIT